MFCNVNLVKHNKTINWQILSLSVAYLFTSLMLIFFMPGNSNRMTGISAHHSACELSANHSKAVKNSFKRLDKIMEGRKRLVADSHVIVLLFTAVPSLLSIFRLKPSFNTYSYAETLKAAQSNLLFCCWRLWFTYCGYLIPFSSELIDDIQVNLPMS